MTGYDIFSPSAAVFLLLECLDEMLPTEAKGGASKWGEWVPWHHGGGSELGTLYLPPKNGIVLSFDDQKLGSQWMKYGIETPRDSFTVEFNQKMGVSGADNFTIDPNSDLASLDLRLEHTPQRLKMASERVPFIRGGGTWGMREHVHLHQMCHGIHGQRLLDFSMDCPSWGMVINQGHRGPGGISSRQPCSAS